LSQRTSDFLLALAVASKNLQEPVEEGAAVRLVHGHGPGVLREPHRWLLREPLHAVCRLLCRGHGVHRCATDNDGGAEREGEREQGAAATGGHRVSENA
jgi:hypothetical protein